MSGNDPIMPLLPDAEPPVGNIIIRHTREVCPVFVPWGIEDGYTGVNCLSSALKPIRNGEPPGPRGVHGRIWMAVDVHLWYGSVAFVSWWERQAR